MNDRSARRQVALPTSFGGDGVRRRILEGALRLFAQHGFAGASVRDLATRIEVQPSAVYAHFTSKEHVLAELIRAGHEAHHDALQNELLQTAGQPIAQLRALVRAHVRTHATYPELAIVVNQELERLSPELAAEGLALRRQSSAMLMKVLERGVANGSFSITHLHVTAAAIGAIGLRIPHWYTPELGIGIDELAAMHVQLALRMVGAREDAP